MVQSICLSVCISVCLSVPLSVCHTFFTMFPSWYNHEIFRSDYQWQKCCLCKRPRPEVKSQAYRGQNPTLPSLDHNSSLISHMVMVWCLIGFQGHLSNFKVTQLKKIIDFHPNWAFRDYLQFEFTDGYEMMHKVCSSIEEVPYCFSRSSIKF